MKNILKSLLIASALALSGGVVAYGADVNLSITNYNNQDGPKIVYLDGTACTGCTTSSTTSIPVGATRVSTSTRNAGATSMTYRIDYSNYYGTSFIKKGCRALITLDVSTAIPAVISWSWTKYAGGTGLYCTTLSSPQVVAGQVNWAVEIDAK